VPNSSHAATAGLAEQRKTQFPGRQAAKDAAADTVGAVAGTGTSLFFYHRDDCHIQPVEIAPAIRSAIQRFPFKEQAQKSWIHVDIDGDCSVNAIPVLIDHLIFNLLKNCIYAIQAAGRGPCGEIRIRLAADRHRQSLYLRDNGQGIPTALLPRVFDPFFSTRANGTGLGLHFCRSVMNRFGGAIHCRSVPGEFTEIVLEFPRLESEAAQHRRS
jgi:signal transduction histidine kinase